jgi:hypothetical protein
MKNAWSAPQLTNYGSVEELTQATRKAFGSSDGFIVTIVDDIDVPIKNLGS